MYNKILIAVISDPFLRLTTPEHDLTDTDYSPFAAFCEFGLYKWHYYYYYYYYYYMVKSSDEFANGCIPMHCGARVDHLKSLTFFVILYAILPCFTRAIAVKQSINIAKSRGRTCPSVTVAGDVIVSYDRHVWLQIRIRQTHVRQKRNFSTTRYERLLARHSRDRSCCC